MKRSAPRPFGFFMAAAGFGIALWCGYDLVRAPAWSDTQVEQMVDLRVASRLHTQAGPLPDERAIDALREQERAALVGGVEDERHQKVVATAMGLAVGAFGIVQMFLLRRRNPAASPVR